MAMAFTKSLTAAAIAGVIALSASVAPASADWRHGGGGWHGGGGGWHGGGWHGGYGGGWHHGGGYGWGPLAVGGILAGAAIASGAYYYGGYGGDPCYRPVATYDQFGNYVGRHWARVC